MMTNAERQSIISKIHDPAGFAIYGAQVVAYGAYTALKSLYSLVPQCFIVSKMDGNPARIDGIGVIGIASCKLKRETLIIVAVTELLQDEICKKLLCFGFYNVLKLDAHTEHLLMSAYFDHIGKFKGLGDSQNMNHSFDLCVYECHSQKDKSLSNPPILKTWERKFIAGATDIHGENIASKNHMYSEMTAAYWVWKNTVHQYKGIAHYRRHLLLTDKQICELSWGKTDAILPLPYICYHSALAQLSRFVSADVIKCLFDTLKTLRPKQYDRYMKILENKYQYTYNLVIAKDKVFDAYCTWTFQVLEHMELSSDKIPEIANTRALSYIAEALTNLYFMSNAHRLAIGHVEKGVYI